MMYRIISKKVTRTMAMFLAGFWMMVGTCGVVLAAGEDDVKEYIEKYCVDAKGDPAVPTSAVGIISMVPPEESSASKYASYTTGEGVKFYYRKDESSISKVSGLLKAKKNSEKAGDKLDEITDHMSLEADIISASVMLDGFKPAIETTLGWITMAIMYAMFLYTAFDICYILFPVFRAKSNDVASSSKVAGRSYSGKGGGGGGEMVPRFVTNDAVYTVKVCTIESGKNPLLTYLVKHVGSWVALGIIIVILLTNNISMIVSIVLYMIQGIMEVIGGFGS